MELLKRMVLPDGNVLLCTQPGRPTLDCLFADCMRDKQSLLKVRLTLLMGTGRFLLQCVGRGLPLALSRARGVISVLCQVPYMLIVSCGPALRRWYMVCRSGTPTKGAVGLWAFLMSR